MKQENSDLEPQKIYRYLIDELKTRKIKHEGHEFASGAIMLDIWHNDSFYVLQIEQEFVGFSQINDDNPGFTTVPDLKFFSLTELMKKLQSVLDKK